MKKKLLWLLMPIALISVLMSRPMTQPAQARTLRVFLIGNSFSQNATTYLPQFAKEGGHEIILGRAEGSGYTMQQHWDAVEAAEANPADAKGKPYAGKSLRELLSAGTWDIVTIQQGSIASSYVDSYRPYAAKLYDFVKKLQPQAEVVVHETWPYRSDAPDFSYVAANGVKAQSNREMYEKLLVAYHTVAAELGARLIPTGDAFWRVASDSQWGYKKDLKFDFANPVAPNLPDQTNSLNEGYRWDGGKLVLDPRHANEAGKYLGGLVWYGVLFGESPEKVTSAPPSIPAPFAAHLRQVAALTLGLPTTSPSTRSATATSTTTTNTPTASTPSTPVKPATQPPAQAPAGKGITTAQGKGADTSVRGGSYAARNFGTLPVLKVCNLENLEHARKAYVRFDLSLLPQAVKGAKSAAITLTVAPAELKSPADKNWTFTVYGLKDGTNDEWGEGAISWNNAPASDPQSASGVTADAVALGTFTITGPGQPGTTVTVSSPELLKFLQSDTDRLATVIIIRNDEGDTGSSNVVHTFASKESADLAPPTLNVGF